MTDRDTNCVYLNWSATGSGCRDDTLVKVSSGKDALFHAQYDLTLYLDIALENGPFNNCDLSKAFYITGG